MEDELVIDKSVIKALNSNTRIKILKALNERNKTLAELSRELSLSKPALLEHLDILNNSELIVKIERSGSNIMYYSLTHKGIGILNPSGRVRAILLLTTAIFSLAASLFELIKFVSGKKMKVVEEFLQVPGQPPVKREVEVLYHDLIELTAGIALLLLTCLIIYILLKPENRTKLKLIFVR
jgi:DNA-binding transcriptional ArsR family regulator